MPNCVELQTYTSVAALVSTTFREKLKVALAIGKVNPYAIFDKVKCLIQSLEFSSPEEIIYEARNGRIFVLLDDKEAENDCSLDIPAQLATPVAINSMAKFGLGLIRLTLTQRLRVNWT